MKFGNVCVSGLVLAISASAFSMGAKNPRPGHRKYIFQTPMGESYYEGHFFERRVPEPARCYLIGYVVDGNIYGQDKYGKFPIAFIYADNNREGRYILEKTLEELHRSGYCQ